MITTRLTPLLRRKQKGSAYLELVVVFVFLAAIFAVMLPTYFNYVDKAKLTLARNTASTMGKALELYHHKHKRYPVRIDFATGQDSRGTAVFTASLLEQIGSDFASIVSYSGSPTTYILTVTANDKKQTTIRLTPDGATSGDEP